MSESDTAVAVACVLWWAYFAFVPEAIVRALRSAKHFDRGRMARDRFTLGHFPIVFGLVLYAVGAVIVAIMQAITLRRYDRLSAERLKSAHG